MQRGNREYWTSKKKRKKQSVNIPQQIVYLQMYTCLIEPIQKQSDTVIRKHYTDHDYNAWWQLIGNGAGGRRSVYGKPQAADDCAIWAESVAPRRPRCDWWEGTRLTWVREAQLRSKPFITGGRRLQLKLAACLRTNSPAPLRFTRPQFV